jgi:hypothetical protein
MFTKGSTAIVPGRRRRRRTVWVAARERDGEPITTSRNRCDRLLPEDLAQRGDLHLQIVLFDDELRPDPVQQLLLGHQLTGPLQERDEHIESARADHHRLAARQQAALAWV